MHNIFACLVHENQECVVDLVRNLRYLDPPSMVLLYNGGKDPRLLKGDFPWERYGAVVHPQPRPLAWGRLHDFALDCMQFALDHLPFDTLTIVDSDQLAIRANYSHYLAQCLSGHSDVGMLSNAPAPQSAHTPIGPAVAAFKEIDLWRTFLRRFAEGERKFVHWTFWPSTVFTAEAARALTHLFATDRQLQDIVRRTKIWATEEVILPTLVALLGYKIVANPCSDAYVKFRARYTLRQIDEAFARADVFWVHPITRHYGDVLRRHIRSRCNHYERPFSVGGNMPAAEMDSDGGLLLTWPILMRMKPIEGWLEEDEADLLIAVTSRALGEMPKAQAVVEVGSYCGRSTVVLGSVIKAVSPKAKVYAIDPHDGKVGALDEGISQGPPTLEKFKRNIAAAGLTSIVELIQKYSFEVSWQNPICLLFIDGLHDYANVARDFFHFEPWIVDGGYIAFHDYADYYPGVKAFVHEILHSGGYRKVHLVRSMMVVQKLPAVESSNAEGAQTPRPTVQLDDPRRGTTANDRRHKSTSGRTLASFKDIHRGETIIVCGCGESLNDLTHPDQFLTIGVNDVGRRFQPNYLVVVNPRQQFSGDRFRYVETSQAEYLFTQLDLGVPHPNVVKFQLGAHGGTDFSNPNVLHYTQNSPYVALCLAAHMGARYIGLIGVDFTDHHFFAQTGAHRLARQLTSIDAQYRRLSNALRASGVEVFNLSRTSRLTAFPKRPIADLRALTKPVSAPCEASLPLRIVSYATTPVAGVPAILARCISARTPHTARCVWAQNGYGNGVIFEGDIQWKQSPAAAEAALVNADVVIVHNGKVEPHHRSLLAGKAVITMAHNYMWNVDQTFVRQGFPGIVVGQYQATLPEFQGWSAVPNPVPLWEEAFQPGQKEPVMTVCYTPFGKHERYPPDHRLYWHSKGYDTTMRALDRLAARFPLQLEVTRDRQVSHAEALAMKRRAHMVIDECVTGSYHRSSLEGLAAGCVVVNAVGLLPAVVEVLRYCSSGASTVPFVYAGLDELESVLTALIQRHIKTLSAEGASNRRWMEQHWDFVRQWQQFWTPVVDQALERAGRKKQPNRVAPLHPAVGGTTRVDVRRENATVQDVSIIIPHGKRERLRNLIATLANLRQCHGVGDIIVVEMDEAPSAQDIVRQWADRYVFIHNKGLFNRARALNVGIPFTKHDLVLWLDNDLVIPAEFLVKAVAELRSRQLDCLVPWTSIRYLSEEDSGKVIAGSRRALDCLPMHTYTSRQACGAAVLIRKAFILQYGGMCEEFRGWGGEDGAWFYKARLLGRVAVTERHDQHLYHLFHEHSGGYDSRNHVGKNPHYRNNVALLKTIRSITGPQKFLQRFPPPSHFSCPWQPDKRLIFVREASGTDMDRMAEHIAEALANLYGITVEHYNAGSHGIAWHAALSAQPPDAVVLFGTALALRLLADDSCERLSARMVIVHDAVNTDLTVEKLRSLGGVAAHLTAASTMAQVLIQAGLRRSMWIWDREKAGDPMHAALALVQPLSLVLASACTSCLPVDLTCQDETSVGSF